jgi:uncharacterized damage-inducible protein DinB
MYTKRVHRRRFLKTAACAIAASPLALARPPIAADRLPTTPDDEASKSLLGPKDGYATLVGTLVSMLTWNRSTVVQSVKKLKQSQLDFLLDDSANTIGALLLHLAATETYYAAHTFDGVAWDKFPDSLTKQWDVPMNLGEEARKSIKGHSIDYYLSALDESRTRTLAGLKRRDDKWLLEADKAWPWGATNNFCKWFHVCEHESNHRGQMTLLRKRAPGAADKGE